MDRWTLSFTGEALNTLKALAEAWEGEDTPDNRALVIASLLGDEAKKRGLSVKAYSKQDWRYDRIVNNAVKEAVNDSHA